MDMEEAREDVITLIDEQGVEHTFTALDIIEVDNKEYALLLPADSENPEEEEVLVLRFEDDNLVMIEDEAEFQRVVQYLEELSEEE
jgi:putative Holliday junction resolvase